MNMRLISLARAVFAFGFSIVLTLSLILAPSASMLSELEPNDTPETANPLASRQDSEGNIDPSGDVDYYEISGGNELWGFIALLDNLSSSTSANGTLTAFNSDGITELQADSGSWVNGSVIALQRFVDGNDSYYIRVEETGNDDTITPYFIRYYQLAFSEKPEVEPNDTRETGTIAAKTNFGTLGSSSDIDCFAFYGQIGEEFLFVLNANPESVSDTTNYALTVYDPDDILLASVDTGGLGGNELIDNTLLTKTGVYAYCISPSSGTIGLNANYLAGLLRNEHNYWSTFEQTPSWIDPRPGGYALIDDQLTFQLSFTNTSPLTIPDEIRMQGSFDDNCLSLVSAPSAVYTTTNLARWETQNLGPGEVFSATLVTRAEATCSSNMHQSVSMDYFVLGVGKDVDYEIYQGIYLPHIAR